VQLAVPLKPAMDGVSAYTQNSGPGKPYYEPFDEAVTVEDVGIFQPSPEEREVLGSLKSFTLKTVLFRADPFPLPTPVYPGEVWVGPLEEYKGSVRYLTNSEISVLGTEPENGKTGCAAA
jgi:hypothetical protein